MAFNVQLTQAAKVDLAETMDFLTEHAPHQAQKWFDGLFASMESLSEMPTRHALISESPRLNRDLRAHLYYSHRIVYEVNVASQTVSIIRIYHFARSPLELENLD